MKAGPDTIFPNNRESLGLESLRNADPCRDPENPRVPRDQFFTMDEATRIPRRMGAYRTMAQDIGEGHWAVKLQPPGHGQNHVMANTFYDRSHLNGGMPNAVKGVGR